jgi:hypothetical protein
MNRRAFMARGACLATLPLSGLAAAPIPPAYGLPGALELPVPEMERIAPDPWVTGLAKGIWLTCFTGLIEGGTWFPANGLIVRDEAGSLLVDLGWNRAQAAAMLGYARDRLHLPVKAGIVTH